MGSYEGRYLAGMYASAWESSSQYCVPQARDINPRCHPERSEGPIVVDRVRAEVPRFAQDDRETGAKEAEEEVRCVRQRPSAAKAGIDFVMVTARLKPRPFKTKRHGAGTTQSCLRYSGSSPQPNPPVNWRAIFGSPSGTHCLSHISGCQQSQTRSNHHAVPVLGQVLLRTEN
jgi:hypothetical protein